MNRFFVAAELLAAGPELLLKDDLAHQLSRVLRLGSGSRITLLDGLGQEFETEIIGSVRSGKNEAVQARIVSQRPAGGEPGLQITLYQAILKGEKMDYVLQKGTEVGITTFVPILTERCIGHSVRPERWQKIIKEAAEQSRRGRIPDLAQGLARWPEALDAINKTGITALMAWEQEQTANLKESLSEDSKELAVLIGPEGGFTAGEAELARSFGVKTISLGPRILRAETAGPVLAALVLFQAGDMGG